MVKLSNNISHNKTIEYAKIELEKYSQKVFGASIDVELLLNDKIKDDDGYEINVKNACGYIKGNNERSILMGVYGLFYELGCRWIRPSDGGDYIVKVIERIGIDKTKLSFRINKIL